MTIWYRTWGSEIDSVEIERSTVNSVWVKEKNYIRESIRRHARISEYECYFPTWEEAHAYLLKQADDGLKVARARLEKAQDRYGNIKGMKKP